MITLYSAPTPNGYKVSILLEEMALEYKLRAINLGEQEQKEPWFLALNPNGRIPVIVDHDNDDFAVFESGAIMLYLAEKTGTFLPRDPKAKSIAVQWLMFQMGGLGPMQGQAHVFRRYFPEKIQSVIDRYQGETRRLYEVLNSRLAQSRFLAGEDISIADFANWCWAVAHPWADVSIDALTHLQRWLEEIGDRPAVQAGLKQPPRPDVSDKIVAAGQSMLQTQGRE